MKHITCASLGPLLRFVQMVRRTWFGVLLALMAGTVTALAWRPVADWQLHDSAAVSLASVSRCPLGDDDVQRAGERLRAVTIAASVNGEGLSWPRRCAPYVTGLRQSLSGLHARRRHSCGGDCDDAAFQALVSMRDEAARAALLVQSGHNELFDADRLLSAGRVMGLSASAPSSVPSAPVPARLLDPRSMTPLHVGDYLRLLTDPAGDDTMDLLFYEHESRYSLCNVGVHGDEAASCRSLSATIPVGLAGELFAAEPGAPARMFAQGFEDGVWRQGLFAVRSGRRITSVSQRPAGGFVWRDGTSARLGLEPPMRDLAVFRVDADGEGTPAPLTIDGVPSVGPRLLWDEVFWALPVRGGRHQLFAQRAQRDAELLGPIRELGETAALGERPELEVCRSGRSLAVMLVGQRNRRGAIATLVFRTERGWQQPISVRVGAGRFGFTCRGAGASLSWVRSIAEQPAPDDWSAQDGDAEASDRNPVRGRYAVHRLRCSAEGCSHGRAVLSLHRYSLSSRYVAGDLGDAMVVLWRSALGDIRMRLAPLEQLAAADERPLFDDLEHGGFGWDLERDPIFGRAGGVLVLVSQQVGSSDASATYGFRIKASGQVTPVTVAATEDGAQRALVL